MNLCCKFFVEEYANICETSLSMTSGVMGWVAEYYYRYPTTTCIIIGIIVAFFLGLGVFVYNYNQRGHQIKQITQERDAIDEDRGIIKQDRDIIDEDRDHTNEQLNTANQKKFFVTMPNGTRVMMKPGTEVTLEDATVISMENCTVDVRANEANLSQTQVS